MEYYAVNLRKTYRFVRFTQPFTPINFLMQICLRHDDPIYSHHLSFSFLYCKPLNINDMNQTELLNITEMHKINQGNISDNEQCKALASSRALETYVYVSLSFFVCYY